MSTRRSFALITFAMVTLTLAALASAQTTKPATQPAAQGVNGTWTWTMEGRGGTQDFTLKLKQDGEKLTGTLAGGFNNEEADIEDGKVAGNKISFKVVPQMGGREITTLYTAELKDNTLTGKSETVMSRPFEAKRQQP